MIALVVRLAILYFSWDIKPIYDEVGYIENARQILERGDFAGAYRPPLYSYYLAALMKLFGQDMLWIKLVQVVIGSLTAVIVYLTAKEIASKKAALIAALIYALDPNMAWFSCFFWPETLFMAPFLLSFYLLARNVKSGKIGWFLAAGILLGLSALIKSMILYFMVLVLLWIIMFRKKGKLITASAFLAGVVLALSPWVVRNYYETGSFTLINTNGMQNLYEGNNAIKGYGSEYYFSDRLKDIYASYAAMGKTEVEREKGARKAALAYIASEQPGWFFKKMRNEMPMLWAPAVHPIRHVRMGFYGVLNPLLVDALIIIFVLSYFLLISTAAFGFFHSSRSPAFYLTLILIGYVCAIYTVTHAQPRYLFPVLPFLMAFSGIALTDARNIIASGFSPGNIAAGLLTGLLVYIWYGSYTYAYVAGMLSL